MKSPGSPVLLREDGKADKSLLLRCKNLNTHAHMSLLERGKGKEDPKPSDGADEVNIFM